MNAIPTASIGQHEPALMGQTVLIIGGSSGIGLETGRLAHAEGAKVILTGRDPERLRRAADDVGAMNTASFDATEFELLKKFFDELPAPVDHVLVTGPGPYYAPLAEFDFDRARRDIEAHLLLPLQIARLDVGLKGLAPQGYVIRHRQVDDHTAVVIAANDDVGVLYGVFHFLRLLQTQQPLGNLNVTESSRIQLRMPCR